MHAFLAVSEGTLSLNKAREILQFSQILEKNSVWARCTLYTLMYFWHAEIKFSVKSTGFLIHLEMTLLKK